MNLDYLSFEQPIAELEAKIEELQLVGNDNELNISEEVTKLRVKSRKLTENIYAKLTPWQVVQVARHPHRPYSLDYIQRIFTDWEEMHGDRHFGDDNAIVGGIARLADKPVMVIGQEKGRGVTEKVMRNFGMPKAEGYRKALRLMETAERFKLPILTLIDTPGAYPGKGAEERGQSEAIARSTEKCLQIGVPVISVVIGEGGSGGAVAFATANALAMLEHSIYSVISPEGCASILWKDSEKMREAAEALRLTAQDLTKLGVNDHVIAEPMGGAHRDPDAALANVKTTIAKILKDLAGKDRNALIKHRREKFLALGSSRLSA